MTILKSLAIFFLKYTNDDVAPLTRLAYELEESFKSAANPACLLFVCRDLCGLLHHPRASLFISM